MSEKDLHWQLLTYGEKHIYRKGQLKIKRRNNGGHKCSNDIFWRCSDCDAVYGIGIEVFGVEIEMKWGHWCDADKIYATAIERSMAFKDQQELKETRLYLKAHGWEGLKQ